MYKTKALADRFRVKLLRATDKGERFDTVTGLPDSLRVGRTVALSVLELALWYVEHRWPHASAKQRGSMTDALATAVPALVKQVRGRPAVAVVRKALRSYLLPPPRRERERPEEIVAAVRWLERASLPVAELAEITHMHALADGVARKIDGTPAASQTYRRRRAVSQRLNSGVPALDVAARAGHSVEVLLNIYAKCVDGQEAAMNERIMKGLGEEDEDTEV
ncbi:hypothetical protein ACTWP5_13810 [Streptomyces sp. 4N509B]|uniref:hypothetical protein n=1 Tax=Streptomyces sp. 4N509B TaxID=3457413 RepID=UPI003FD1CAE4